MLPEVIVALVASPLALAGALVMRWFDLRARSTGWKREDQQRFMHAKLGAYSEFLSACQGYVLNQGGSASANIPQLVASHYTVLLLAPNHLVEPAQDLLNLTVSMPGNSGTSSQKTEWGKLVASFTEAVRRDLGALD